MLTVSDDDDDYDAHGDPAMNSSDFISLSSDHSRTGGTLGGVFNHGNNDNGGGGGGGISSGYGVPSGGYGAPSSGYGAPGGGGGGSYAAPSGTGEYSSKNAIEK